MIPVSQGNDLSAAQKRSSVDYCQSIDGQQHSSTCRLYITRKRYDIAFIGKYGRDISQRHIKQLMPETTFLSDDNGDDEIEMFDNVKGSIMILEMGQSKKALRFFNTYNPIREVADSNAEQFEMILGYQDGEILRHIEMPECVKKNFLTLLKFGRDGLAQKIDYQRPKKPDVILNNFVCHQFAQFLCSDHILPWQQRFDFINQMVSTEAILDDRFCSIVPVEKKEESFQLCGSIADREKDVGLKPGTRLLFFHPQTKSQTRRLFHSGVYLAENYFIAKDGPGNVMIDTIDSYLKHLSGSITHDFLMYAALPNHWNGYSFYGELV